MKKLISTLIGWHVDTAILWLSEHDVKFALIEKESEIQDCSFKNADILLITSILVANSHVEGIIFNTWI